MMKAEELMDRPELGLSVAVLGLLILTFGWKGALVISLIAALLYGRYGRETS